MIKQHIIPRTPKFIGFVKALNDLADNGIFQRNPEKPNEILIYRSGMDKTQNTLGITEGFISQPIPYVAQELLMDEQCRNGFFEALASNKVYLYFDAEGEYVKLYK